MVWAPVLVGLLLLVLGRRLYWVFVGAVGFAAGLTLATQLTHRAPDATALVIALLAGLVGVLLAIFLTRLAIALAGFAAGAWVTAFLWNWLSPTVATTPWLPAVVGGVLGALLASTLFDWVLIVVSAVAGAVLVAQYLPIEKAGQGVVVAVLAAIGIAVQAGLLRRSRANP
jgi:uncharacterized membrane protein YsdA (DUF1294 family)